MKDSKKWDALGFGLGICMIAIGVILFFTGYETEGITYYSFGGDYYTEQYRVTGNVVANINNLIELIHLLGCLLFIFIGALTTIKYGKLYFSSEIETTTIADSTANIQKDNDLPDLNDIEISHVAEPEPFAQSTVPTSMTQNTENNIDELPDL